MTVIVSTVGVNYYLISFLAVTFERPYMQILFSSVAEILAYVTSGYIFTKFGARTSLASSLTLSAVAGCAILIYGQENSDKVLFTVLVMLCKFGVSATYNLQLCTIPQAFPTSFIATGFGFAHFFSVVFSISTPFIADIREPVPIVLFSVLCAIAAIISLLLSPLSIK